VLVCFFCWWSVLASAAGALRVLDGLLATGDPKKSAFPVLGAIAWSLTKLAQAGRLAIQGTPVRDALAKVGARGPAEAQLRHLGRQRVGLIYDWLLEVNVLFRSTDHAPEQLLLEQLLVRLSHKGDAARA
jgi:hypothetical protein